jgi:hypothetical protein
MVPHLLLFLVSLLVRQFRRLRRLVGLVRLVVLCIRLHLYLCLRLDLFVFCSGSFFGEDSVLGIGPVGDKWCGKQGDHLRETNVPFLLLATVHTLKPMIN